MVPSNAPNWSIGLQCIGLTRLAIETLNFDDLASSAESRTSEGESARYSIDHAYRPVPAMREIRVLSRCE